MPKTLLIIIFLACVTSSFAQGFIGDNKKHSRKWLEEFYAKENKRIVVTETDSTLTCLLRDTSVKHLDIILFFDKKGNCYKEQRTLTCDTCFQLMLKETLADKRYEWQAINETDYASSYKKKRLLHAKVAQPFTYVIERWDVSRKEYDLVVRK